MANKTVYPYGTNGKLPSGVAVVNDLTTGGADKALSAEQGVAIKSSLDKRTQVDETNDGFITIGGDYFYDYIHSNTRYLCAFNYECALNTEIRFGFVSETYAFIINTYSSYEDAKNAASVSPNETSGWSSSALSLVISNNSSKWFAVGIKRVDNGGFSDAEKTAFKSYTAKIITYGILVQCGKCVELDSAGMRYGDQPLDNVISELYGRKELVGAGNSALDYVIHLIAGHKYRIEPSTTSWSTTGVSYTVLSIQHYNNGVATVDASARTISDVEDYYDIDAVNADYYVIRYRGAVGATVTFSVTEYVDANLAIYDGENLQDALTDIENNIKGKVALADTSVNLASSIRLRCATHLTGRPRRVHVNAENVPSGFSFAIQTNYTKADALDVSVYAVESSGWNENDFLISRRDAPWLCLSFKKNNGNSFSENDINTLLSSNIAISLDEPYLVLGSSDIISLNDEDNTLKTLRSLTTPNYAPLTYTAGIIPFTLLHFSDLHGDSVNLERIIQYRDKYSSFIDDAICTGDIIKNKFSEDFTFWAAKNAEDVLVSTGNHEYYNGESSAYYTTITPKQVYDKFFAPNIENWGSVVFPTDAATDGYNYYYKDYSSKKIRLIVLDNMANMAGTRDNVQATWLASVLEDARTSGLHVICALHIGSTIETIFDNPFTSYKNIINADGGGAEGANAGTYAEFYTLRDAVDTFIAAGGNFVAWIGGHRHVDCIGILTGHNQAQINVATASSGNAWSIIPLGDDCDRTNGTRQQDCFNIYSVDTEKKLLRIFRVGSNIDKNGRGKNHILYDYENKLVKYND